jgi:hypothetical protein
MITHELIKAGITIQVNYKVELINIIKYLSNYYANEIVFHERPDLDNSTFMNVQTRFQNHKDHPLIRYFNQIYPQGFNFGCLYETILSLSDDMTFFTQDQEIAKRLPQDQINTFFRLLGEFILDTKFKSFWSDYTQSYSNFLKVNVDSIPDGVNYSNQIENYYGYQKGPITLIISPTFCRSGFGVNVDGTQYAIIGYSQDKHGIPLAIVDGFDRLLIHEISHSYVNPLVNQWLGLVPQLHEIEINSLSPQYQEYYNNSTAIIIELCVRAVTSRIVSLIQGEKEGELALHDDLAHGFTQCEVLYQMLKSEYETDRNQYKTIDSFIPKMIHKISVIRNLTVNK